jgi:hypothetical protein
LTPPVRIGTRAPPGISKDRRFARFDHSRVGKRKDDLRAGCKRNHAARNCYDFLAASDLKMNRGEARRLLSRAAAQGSDPDVQYIADLCAALISDAAVDQEQTKVEPTPLACPSVATSNFLKNFPELSRTELPEKEKRGRDPSYPHDLGPMYSAGIV